MTSKWLAFIHSLDVKQNKPFLKPVSQRHTLSASRETLGIIQSNSSNFLGRKQRSRKGSKLGSGSQEENPSPLVSTIQLSLFIKCQGYAHRGNLYRKEQSIGTTTRKGLEEFMDLREEAGKNSPTKQCPGREAGSKWRRLDNRLQQPISLTVSIANGNFYALNHLLEVILLCSACFLTRLLIH